ncbi:MAG: AMP-binding protein, partial [Parvibaculales bacterium]
MKYKDEYQHSIKNKESFWSEQGKRIDWIRPYSKVKNTHFSDTKVDIRWYEDGTLNACANCIDRHLEKRGDKVALLWEGDEPSNDKKVTYKELYEAVCRFANVLKKEGVKKGDRVTIYMPMIIEAAYAMLACARIGAVHSVVFGGFSAEALAGRIEDCRSDFVISADEGIRGGKKIPLKKNLDKALEQAKNVRRVLLVQNSGGEIEMRDGRDIWLHEALEGVEPHCPPEEMSAEDPLFILYTSGSTGTPKGVLHSTGGYMVYVSLTHERVFDYQESDIYWCTADIGWVTGHSYMIYGPLANGATTLLFEGVPNYPDAGRFWQVCDKYGVSIFYTAPTA